MSSYLFQEAKRPGRRTCVAPGLSEQLAALGYGARCAAAVLSRKSSRAFFSCVSSGFGATSVGFTGVWFGLLSSSLFGSSTSKATSGLSGRLTSTEGVTPERLRSSPRNGLPLADAHLIVVNNNPSPSRSVNSSCSAPAPQLFSPT